MTWRNHEEYFWSIYYNDNVCQGLTVTTDEAGKVIVARIIIDSVIERQGLLRPGDLILEANSVRVKTPEQLQNLIEDSPEFLSLKIQPTLSVSQSQPLNTASQEKSVTSLPNKVNSSFPTNNADWSAQVFKLCLH